MTLFNKSQIAKYRGVTKPSVNNAVNTGKLVENEEGLIDANNIVNRAWLLDINTQYQTPSGGDSEPSNDPALQKMEADIELKLVMAKLKTFQLSERMEVMIDEQTVADKFGAFADYMLNELIPFPDNVADLVVGAVKTSKNPKQEVAALLRDQLSVIIKRGKEIAKKVVPPKEGAKYVYLEGE